MECQEISARVQSLEAAEAAARAATAGLVGAEAWAALAQLGSLRRELDDARTALTSCVASHSGALGLEFVVVGDGPPPLPTSREAQLYEPGQLNPTLRSPLVGGRFSFAGPLPAHFGIIVVSQGLPDLFVVDFRTGPIQSASLAEANGMRAEVVVGPDVRFSAAQVAQWVSAIALPTTIDVPSSAGGVSARVTVVSISATLARAGFTLHAGGSVDWFAAGFPTQTSQFTAVVPLTLLLPATPLEVDPCDVRVVGEPDVQVSGSMGGLVAAMLPAVRGKLESMLTAHFQRAVVRGIDVVVADAFALPTLPKGSRVALRRLRIEEDAVSFQPAIGAMGTLLSTFQPPGTT